MHPLQIVAVLLLLSGGAVLASALVISRRERLNLEHHVNLVAGQPRSGTQASSALLVRSAWIDEAVRRAFCIGVRYRWGMRTRGVVLLGIAATSVGITWLLVYQLLGHATWLAAPLGALAFFMVPRLLLLRQQRRAERQFMELFPNAIDMLIRMLRAGLPITSAVHSIGVESPRPFGTLFASIARQVDIGVPFEKALDSMSKQIGLPDFRFFSVAITLQHATGGNLAATLEILSDIIRRRRAVRLKAIAATGEVRVSAYVLGGLPIVTIGALLLLQPDYVAPLLYDNRGKYILATAVGLLMLAFVTMRLMMRRVTAV